MVRHKLCHSKIISAQKIERCDSIARIAVPFCPMRSANLPPRRQHLARSNFSAEEDTTLRAMVTELGTGCWAEVAKSLPGRNARQCRERWKHYLSCDKAAVAWTAEEDNLIFEQISAWGPKWTRVAAVLGNRTDLEVKMQWLKKFNHILPMLPKPTRIAHQKESGPPEKDRAGNPELMNHHPGNEFTYIVNLRDEWLTQSPAPWNPAPRSDDWVWQQ
jgi:hypothetical protein